MALTAALVDSTPYRLRYLVTQDGVATSPPGLNETLTIGNATLLADSSAGPVRDLINAQTNGYPPRTTGTPRIAAGAAMTQAQARALLNSDDAAGATLTNDLIGRSVVELVPRTAPNVAWAVDVNVVANDPVLVVTAESGTAATAYVDLHFRHSYDL